MRPRALVKLGKWTHVEGSPGFVPFCDGAIEVLCAAKDIEQTTFDSLDVSTPRGSMDSQLHSRPYWLMRRYTAAYA